LVFDPGKQVKYYLGVIGWIEAKCPKDAYIYDTVHNLTCCQVPIRDAYEVNGLLVRRPIQKPVEAKVLAKYATRADHAVFLETNDKIMCANTKTSHTMKY
jgi:hypothetical protein